jgi:hypothetical protein
MNTPHRPAPSKYVAFSARLCLLRAHAAVADDLEASAPLEDEERDTAIALSVAPALPETIAHWAAHPIDWTRIEPHPALARMDELCMCGMRRGEHAPGAPEAGVPGDSMCTGFELTGTAGAT